MKVFAADCETDPFALGRIPEPFLWGIYDGKNYNEFKTVPEFMEFCAGIKEKAIIYFHNGGKFDIHYLLPFLDPAKAQVISGRIVKVPYKNIQFRDSFACAPAPLAATGSKDDIDYTKLEKDVREEHMDEISAYMKQDCVALYDLMKAYHKKVGKKVTLASNAMAFAKKNSGVIIPKTTYLYDQKFREYYYGGRVEARQGGKFENVHVYDIKSAYPHAMTFKHPIGNQYTEKGGYIKDADFYTINCNAFNCFPFRGKDKKLIFPCETNTYNITGWEYQAAKELNLIKEADIIKSIKFNDHICFTEYVEYWYEEKQKAEKAGNKRDRLISKLLLNSLYGKLAQNPLNYEQWAFRDINDKPDSENGWYLSHMIQCFNKSEIAIHKRDMINEFEEKYDNWQTEKLFFNVATGASITGFVRAMLIRAIHTDDHRDVIYCDTDSVASLSPLAISDTSGKLGTWEKEGVAKEMIVCGKKLYGITWEDGTQKVSSKGSKLSYEEIKRINNGEIVTWEKEAPTFSLSRGINFISRNIQKTV